MGSATTWRRAAGAGAATALVLLGGPPPARADAPSPLYALVDAAAQRLQTADAVAAAKWTTGGAIEDPVRERRVIEAVTQAATAAGVDPHYVDVAFRDQIDATVAVEYALFSQWKLDPASAPTTAPDLSRSRDAIDVLNHTMVSEMARQWDSLHSEGCATDLDAARTAVAADRTLDDLYQRALAFATRSYCSHA